MPSIKTKEVYMLKCPCGGNDCDGVVRMGSLDGGGITPIVSFEKKTIESLQQVIADKTGVMNPIIRGRLIYKID